jgi:hypothetical protein
LFVSALPNPPLDILAQPLYAIGQYLNFTDRTQDDRRRLIPLPSSQFEQARMRMISAHRKPPISF